MTAPMPPAPPTVTEPWMRWARWHYPTRVILGVGVVEGLARECDRLAARALVVTDRNLGCGPILQRVRAQLAIAGMHASVFDGVVPHPCVTHVEQGIEALRDSGAGVIVGLGGGSSMDVAKTVAAAARNPGLLHPEAWEAPSGLVVPSTEPTRRAFSLVQIPTTAATGSEVSQAASLRAGQCGKKRLLVHPILFAQVALIDPEFAVTVPPRQTAEGSLEVLCRLLVPYLTQTSAHEIPDLFCESVMQVLLRRTADALEDPADLAARADLALAATASVAGWALFGRHPWANPLWCFQSSLTSSGDMAKGSALAALLPAYLRFLTDRSGTLPQLGDPRRLAHAGRTLFSPESCAQGSVTAEEAVDRFADLLRAWGLPTSLGELGVDSVAALGLTEETLQLWGEHMLPWLSRADLLSFYESAFRPAEAGGRTCGSGVHPFAAARRAWS
jgi:alcohol dehydrogenase class IV